MPGNDNSSPAPATPREGEPEPEEGRHQSTRREKRDDHGAPPVLSAPVRVLLYFTGWLLLLVGLIGLALPGIQGILTLLLGAAVLSLVSEAAHRWIRALFRPWPKGGEHFDRLRKRLHERLARFHRHDRS